MSIFLQQTEFSDPIVIETIDRPTPEPGPGEVLVRIHAAGVNPVDWKIASGAVPGEFFGAALPSGLGNDLAGTVEAVGEGVDGFTVGDRVYGGARGKAFAEHAVIAADALHPTPDGLEDTVAGSLQIAAGTADAAVTAAGPTAGETVLIGGAAGGVGVIAVQLAAATGATVIATASEHNHAFLRELGTTPTTYGDGLVGRVRELAPQGIDAAIDLQGTETIEAALELGVPPQRISAIAAGPNVPDGVIATGGSASTPAAIERIADEIAAGRITLPIQQTFPLTEALDAFALQREGHVRGKVVVTI